MLFPLAKMRNFAKMEIIAECGWFLTVCVYGKRDRGRTQEKMNFIFLNIVLCVMMLAGPVLSPLYCTAHHHFLVPGAFGCGEPEPSRTVSADSSEMASSDSISCRKKCACAHTASDAGEHILQETAVPLSAVFCFCCFHGTADPCVPTVFADFLGNESLTNYFFSLLVLLASVSIVFPFTERFSFLRRRETASIRCLNDKIWNSGGKLRLYLLKNSLLN